MTIVLWGLSVDGVNNLEAQVWDNKKNVPILFPTRKLARIAANKIGATVHKVELTWN